MTGNSTPSLPPELAHEAATLLHNLRAKWMQYVSDEVESQLPALSTWETTGKAPEGVPAWLRNAVYEAAMPDNSLNWASLRSHLTNKTFRFISRMATMDSSLALREAMEALGAISYHFKTDDPETPSAVLAEVTGYGLAKVLGIDLYEYAAEGWAGLDGPYALIMTTTTEAR